MSSAKLLIHPHILIQVICFQYKQETSQQPSLRVHQLFRLPVRQTSIQHFPLPLITKLILDLVYTHASEPCAFTFWSRLPSETLVQSLTEVHVKHDYCLAFINFLLKKSKIKGHQRLRGEGRSLGWRGKNRSAGIA